MSRVPVFGQAVQAPIWDRAERRCRGSASAMWCRGRTRPRQRERAEIQEANARSIRSEGTMLGGQSASRSMRSDHRSGASAHGLLLGASCAPRAPARCPRPMRRSRPRRCRRIGRQLGHGAAGRQSVRPASSMMRSIRSSASAPRWVSSVGRGGRSPADATAWVCGVATGAGLGASAGDRLQLDALVRIAHDRLPGHRRQRAAGHAVGRAVVVVADPHAADYSCR